MKDLDEKENADQNGSDSKCEDNRSDATFKVDTIASDSYNLFLNKPEVNALKSGHCMKEDCSICKALDNVEECSSSVILPVPARELRDLEKDSNISLGICRICHCNPDTLPEMGPLESVCRCRGTVALVHISCLERWLAESDTTYCELCRFQFNIQRIPKHGAIQSIFIWANEVADFNQVKKDFICFLMTLPLVAILVVVAFNTLGKLVTHCVCSDASSSRACAGVNHFLFCLAKIIQYNLKFKLLMDTVWFWLMTPLAAMAGYIFIRAASELVDDSYPTEAPWLMAALLLNSCLTMIAYYGWVMTSIKRHIFAWYKWWRTMDSVIKVLTSETSSRTSKTSVPSSS